MIYNFSSTTDSFKTQIFKCLILVFCLISLSLSANNGKSKNNKDKIDTTVLAGGTSEAYKLTGISFKEDSLFTPEQMREDLLFYYDKVLKIHPNPYHVINKDSLEKRIADILTSLDKPMNRREFWLKIATFNACFDGHTSVSRIRETYGNNNATSIFSDNLLRLDSLENALINPRYKDSLLAGKYIKSINDIPIKQIINDFSAYYSYESKNMLSMLFSNNFSWTYNNIFEYADSLQIEYIKENNETGIRAIYPRKITPDTASSTQTKPETEWKALRFNLYEEESITIIEINTSIIFTLGKNYRKDLEKMMSAVVEKDIKHLFIDVSRNEGGGSIEALEILNFIKTEKKKYYYCNSEFRISPVLCKYKFGSNDMSSFINAHKKSIFTTFLKKYLQKTSLSMI